MSLFQVNKPKSAPKVMVPSSDKLTKDVVETLAFMASMAGITLGPGGRQVLVERPEVNMRPIITKDGVTVIKNLGYDHPVKQLILEAARDAAIRTANEAGDGTTTATVLSAAIVRHTVETVKANSKISPQRIVREMERIVPEIVALIKGMKIDVDGDDYESILLKVASLSANGDVQLAKKIVEGNDMVGDEGDMTIVEINGGGDSRYELEKINGYTVERGYEESLRTYANGFINDRTGTMVGLKDPIFLLYDGVINDFSQIFDALQKLHREMSELKIKDQNVVIVSHGFSDQVLGDLHANWNHPKAAMKVFPLQSPEKAIMNWKTNFLYDLQAYTGTQVFNPVDKPLIDLNGKSLVEQSRVKAFECSRFKAMIFAKDDAAAVDIRVEELTEQKKNPESDYELNDLNVRIGKLTSGIVRLNIYGPIAGETREKRDRAEDAWMALKGAIKHGAVPGGGYVLVRLAAYLQTTADKMESSARKHAVGILGEALLAPVRLLYRNYGYNEEDTEKHLLLMLKNDEQTFDIPEEKWVNKTDLLDSLPAVSEAIRNSIAISSLLGTMGGIVAFQRDFQTDKEEERLVRQFEAAIGERGSVNGVSDQ
jgi:chaperonin GroEL